jgi:uncharacterized alkaline shock family protein YloU
MINSRVDIETKTIMQIIANTAATSYGIVGLSGKSNIINGINKVLNRNKIRNGVDVSTDENGLLIIDVRIFINNGLPIKQVINSLTNKIKFELEQYDIIIEELNIYVMGVK